MKVHFISNTAFPYGGATTIRTFSYAKGLIDNGVECEVIIPIPTCAVNDKLNVNNKGVYNGIPFRYFSSSPRRSSSFIMRRLNDFVGYVRTLFYILRIPKGDILLFYNNTNLLFKLALPLCKLKGLKTVLEQNELPHIAGEQTRERIKKRDEMLEKILPKFDGVIVISEALKQLVNSYSKAETLKVPIITPPDIEQHSNNDKDAGRYIFHSGSLTEVKDGVCGMIEAFGMALPHIGNDVKYILTGNLDKSPDKENLKAIISKYSLENNIVFTGYLAEDELRHYQANCTMVIINKYDSLQNKYCFATKLSEYLVMKRPVVTTNIGEAMYFLKDEVNAYIVEPGNPRLIAEKIVEIFNNPIDAKKIGECGYELTKKEFNYLYQGKRIIDFFNGLTKK